MGSDAFVRYLSRHRDLIEDCVLARTPAPSRHLDQAIDLDRYYFGPIVRFVSAGGKLIRPALCLLGAEAVGADPSVALPCAAAVELFQAAALIHDDIADDSTMRRGEPCVHRREGTGLAINAGDGALVAASRAIVSAEGMSVQLRMRLLDELLRMEERTLEGQALDLGWSRDGRWDLTSSDYLVMARCKTAYYSCAVPLVLGTICGGGSAAQVEGLRRFGMRCGLAFQIQDDLLNLVGDAEAQGKDFRSDIAEGKRTLVMVRALELLDGARRAELVRILSAKTSDERLAARAVELAQESGALEYARSYAAELVKYAKDELPDLGIAEEAQAVLISMSDFFIQRAK